MQVVCRALDAALPIQAMNASMAASTNIDVMSLMAAAASRRS